MKLSINKYDFPSIMCNFLPDVTTFILRKDIYFIRHNNHLHLPLANIFASILYYYISQIS